MGLAGRAAGLVVTAGAPRAVGARITFADVPDRVRAWVRTAAGAPVVAATEQTGGMSPGCATRLLLADGRRVFVKAVGPELNPDTPTMFRREAHALGLLGRDPLWAALLDALDEPDGWVALLLEDVPGRHPDLSADEEMHALLRSTDALVATVRERIGPLPLPRSDTGGAALLDTRQVVLRWASSVERAHQISPHLLPGWVRAEAPTWHRRTLALADAADGDHLVHWDVRDDNLIRRDDGSIVFVDWGAASRGPAWADPLLARLERVDEPFFDDSVAQSPALAALGDEHVTTFLVALGSFLADRAETAVDVNLPALRDFRRRESARFLEGARRRLDETGPADLGGRPGRW